MHESCQLINLRITIHIMLTTSSLARTLRRFAAIVAVAGGLCAPSPGESPQDELAHQTSPSARQQATPPRDPGELRPPPATTFAPRKATKGREPPGVART